MICDDVFIRHVVVSHLFVCTVCLNGNRLSIIGSTNRNIMRTVHDLENMISDKPELLSIPLRMAERLCEVWKEWSFNWMREGTNGQASIDVPDDVLKFLFSLPGDGDTYYDINQPVIDEQGYIEILRV